MAADYDEQETLYLWGYRFRGNREDENAAEFWGANHELSREASRLAWDMDWLVKHGSRESIAECSDKMMDVKFRQLVAAKKWVEIRSIPSAM
jgi:hypothetical protein